jgi:hypothetical protein
MFFVCVIRDNEIDITIGFESAQAFFEIFSKNFSDPDFY